MKKTNKAQRSVVPVERIEQSICLIRGQKVMLDRDLAELYQVETGHLKRAVRRNIDRFPDDFMFELTKQELEDWRCQFGTSNSVGMGYELLLVALRDGKFTQKCFELKWVSLSSVF